MSNFQDKVRLGRSNLVTSRMGIGADAGIDVASLEWAFERGINYLYWGTHRTEGMLQAIHTLAPRHREEMVVALQTYDITGLAMGTTFRRGLKKLKLDYADVMILGKRDSPVPRRIQDQALALKDAGLVRNLCISAHDRSNYKAHLESGIYDLVMVRYNCAQSGAAEDVFPLVAAVDDPPGVLVYNSTRWGNLFDPAWMPEEEATPEPTHLYRHALSHPSVDMVLTSPQNRAQLEGNLRALEQGPLSEEEAQWLARIGAHVGAKSPNTNWDFLFPSRGKGK